MAVSWTWDVFDQICFESIGISNCGDQFQILKRFECHLLFCAEMHADNAPEDVAIPVLSSFVKT